MMPRLARLLAAWIVLACVAATGLAVEGDITFTREGGDEGTPAAVFPHWIHRIRYKCYACHPEIFPMKANSSTITMELIGEGKSCGACHNGGVAFAADTETCARCHTGQ